MRVETEFGIEIADEDTAGLRTVGQLSEYVKKLAAKSSAASASLGPDFVFRKIVDIVVDQLGVDEEAVTANARFVEDLGLDKI